MESITNNIDSLALIGGALLVSYYSGLFKRRDLWKVGLIVGGEEYIRKTYLKYDIPILDDLFKSGSEIPRVDNKAMLKALERNKLDQMKKEALSDEAIFGTQEQLQYIVGEKYNHEISSKVKDRIQHFSRSGYYK